MHMNAVVGIPPGFFTSWYRAHGRCFPWRDESTSPFGILVAEVLLKQTRAEMVAQAWPTITIRYPSPTQLACASPGDLHALVVGLGFGHQRTQALLDLASAVNRKGGLPSEPGELMKLPYVGMYTAHAVACFGFGLHVPVVDLNVVRVLSRITGTEQPRDIRRAGPIWELAWKLLPEGEAREHNYGMLDFAASLCRARSPKCGECPIAVHCAYARDQVNIDVRLQQDDAR